MTHQIPDSLDVSIILPTFNEAENLPILIPKIFEVLSLHGLSVEVVVVDDHSPDHTALMARTLGKTYPVRVIERLYERGLSSAVIRGFQSSRAQVCVVMDADGSHPVEKLPDMILPILNQEVEVTVGSRNIPSGGSLKWPWYRKLMSKTAAVLTIGLTTLSDPTSGFMGVKRVLLAHAYLNPIGWKIVLEVVVKLKGIRLKEVPIIFCDRQYGKSKMTVKQQGLYILHLLRLYTFKLKTRSI